MTWLVTGGAGYIGPHVVRRLLAEEYPVVVLDDLSTGDPARLPAEVPLVTGSVSDRVAVRRVLRGHGVTGVVHLAARKSVAESVAHPLRYYRDNVEGMGVLLAEMADFGVPAMLLSSSAAVYGASSVTLVDEDAPTVPISPYGETKLLCEWLLRSVGTAHGVSWITLRYFNVVGSDDALLADRGHATLFSAMFRAVSAGQPVTVTGWDYDTRDGTGVRDYVHASDVADAHLAAVRRLERGPAADVYNVGCGHGHSVLEVLAAVRDVTGLPVSYVRTPRRAADPPELVAVVDKIQRELAWRARHDLTAMVRSTWRTWDSGPVLPV